VNARDFTPSKRLRPHRPPVFSFREIADRLGTDQKQLASAMSHHRTVPPPKPRIEHQGSGTGLASRAKFYDLKEFRAWWNAEQAARQTTRPD
jgi:hypothetical protein